MNNAVRSQESATYRAASADEDARIEATDTKGRKIIAQALEILERQLFAKGVGGDRPVFTSSVPVKDYLCLKLSALEHEVFGCLWLTNHHQLIRYQELFRGTVNGSAVYPREVIKSALAANAAAVVFVHNHPGGSLEPSKADINITRVLTDALRIMEVRVLDHLIVAGMDIYSFAEHGHL